MKKILLILIATLFIGTAIFAQTAQGFKYQAVVRDGSGAVIQNQTVGLRINILLGSETGSSVYSETWNILTNDFGLVNLIIGEDSDEFAAISWGAGNYWVKIELDENGGTSYTVMGTSQLLSVPYSLYSNAPWSTSEGNIYYNDGNVGIGTSEPHAKFEIQSSNDTLFCVKDDEGRPVFIVYSDGVQVIVDTSNTKSGASGRFLVSGRGIVKNGKDTEFNFMNLTNKNYLIGHNVAPNLDPSSHGKNSILGYEAGHSLETGFEHTMIGNKAGYNTVGGNSNVFIGNNAGLSSVTGIGNVNIGFSAGESNHHDSGKNVFIGQSSGANNEIGFENVHIGYQVGALGVSGSYNVYLGSYAGMTNEGSGNVFIGQNVGNTSPPAATYIDNKLYIDNSITTTPLIWGDFDNDILRVYGSLNINEEYTFPITKGEEGNYLRTHADGSLYWSISKSFDKSEEFKLLKTTVEDQQLQIENLLKENKIFKEKLKALEELIK